MRLWFLLVLLSSLPVIASLSIFQVQEQQRSVMPDERGPSIIIVCDGQGHVAGRAKQAVRVDIITPWQAAVTLLVECSCFFFPGQAEAQSASVPYVRGSVFFVAAKSGMSGGIGWAWAQIYSLAHLKCI